MPGFLDVVAERLVIFDGATGTYLQSQDLTLDDFQGLEGCNEILSASRPDVVRGMHEAYLRAGADVVETNTFGGTRITLAEFGIGDRAFELSEVSARLAKEVAADISTPDRPRFVCGSVGPGTKMPSLGHVEYDTLVAAYREHIRGLLAGGVDLLAVETVYDLLQAKAALWAAQEAMAVEGRRVPLICSVTIETTGTMLLGTEIGAALAVLEPFPIDILGVNCATGPWEMGEHLRVLARGWRGPLFCMPNAGLPEVRDGRTHYPLTPQELVRAHTTFVADHGLAVVGGCCGNGPKHIEALAKALWGHPVSQRVGTYEPSIASVYAPVTLRQETSFLVIGERANANGSRQFRDLLLDGDIDGAVAMAREQVREGAHAIDLNVDYVGRDGAADMETLTARLGTQSTVPLVIDSTEVPVMAAALRHIGGRALLNSMNLEDGGPKLEAVTALCRQFGAGAICLLIDEEGQARDVEWKLRVAHRIHDLAVARGLRPQDLVFDTLTFPLGSGQEDLRRDGIATLDAIRRIKAELPGVYTVLGVSNVSFGLSPAARHVLNSVFLHEAVTAGLDAAIVHASKIVPLHRIPEAQREAALDLVFDRRRDNYDPLLHFLSLFEGAREERQKEDPGAVPVEVRLHRRIVDGDQDGLEDDLAEGLTRYRALDLVNDVLLGGMREVGELFASGEMQLPFVLQSAEAMKAAVGFLEPHMDKVEGDSAKGNIVLATVRGDVHDIGKNLVDIILTNNGYRVHNLGIKVPISAVIEKVHEVGADAIGLSGLLVKSTLVMRDDLVELNERNLWHYPVILGGAALTRRYVEYDLRKVYKGRLFYGKDAFEGLGTMERLVGAEVLPADWGTKPVESMAAASERLAAQRDGAISGTEEVVESGVAVLADSDVPKPPFLGSRVVKGIPLADVARYINETALFRNQWQYRPGGRSAAEYEELLSTTARPQLRALLDQGREAGWFELAVVYGYFRAAGEGNVLAVYADDGRAELTRFTFPRQREDRRLCLADYVRPLGRDGSAADHVAFHVVTVGRRVSEETHRLFEADRYQDYLHLHGLGVELAEALAEFWHGRIRDEWGIGGTDAKTMAGLFRQDYRGCRYSFGYPACPNLEDQALLWPLLDPGRIGVTLTEEFQLEPEQSTSAVVMHHPEAGYFIVR